LNEILDRNLKIGLTGKPEYVLTNFVNGVEHLPVRFSA